MIGRRQLPRPSPRNDARPVSRSARCLTGHCADRDPSSLNPTDSHATLHPLRRPARHSPARRRSRRGQGIRGNCHRRQDRPQQHARLRPAIARRKIWRMMELASPATHPTARRSVRPAYRCPACSPSRSKPREGRDPPRPALHPAGPQGGRVAHAEGRRSRRPQAHARTLHLARQARFDPAS